MGKNVFSVTVTGLEEEIELTIKDIERTKQILKRHEENLKFLNWLEGKMSKENLSNKEKTFLGDLSKLIEEFEKDCRS